MAAMKIAVVGLGGVGCAAAYYLARDGHSVVGLEQFRIDHDRGGSYGGSRIIRRVYPDVLYTRLMDDAYRLWDELQAEASEELLRRCGGLFFGPEAHPEMQAILGALTAAGVPFERWDAPEVMRRFPPFRLEAGEIGVYQEEAGLLRASHCVRAAAASARRHGAELREECPVAAIEGHPEGLQLRLGDGSSLTVDRAVLTVGPWTAPMLAGHVHLPITVTRQQYLHLMPAPGDTSFRIGAFPIWIDLSGSSYYYGFPEHDEVPGVKIACHDLGDRVDPGNVNREVDESYRAQIRAYARRRLPDLTDTITYEKVCLYDNTPNEDFIVDRLPDEPRLCVVGGTSGHGFKFVPLLGRIAASFATDGTPPYDLTRFAITRFA
jgi:sarcosine oxidase